ncbi:hypothetical protein PENSPDRAFT_577085 [Peniophora sp. CONT]|nr:hypothetical protein PENSPDRAFT_577085 [Peniophora sp. CONT]
MPASPTSNAGDIHQNYAASVSSQQGHPAQQRYPPQQQAYADPRSSYPTFLPLAESAMLQANWLMHGFRDAWRWDVVAKLLATDPELRANAAKAALLNGLSALFALALDALVHPFTANSERGFIARNLGMIYTLLWLAPLAAASLWFNSTWTASLARRSYTLRFGPAAFVPPPAPTRNTYLLLLHTLATSAYRFTMLATCALLSFSLGRIPIPILGRLAETAYFSWVNSYYFFEHVWIARGSSLNERVRGLEERWAYYAAFGLPATLACSCSSNPLFNMALFAMLCPPFVLMATHARPVPQEPYAPKGNNAFPSPLVPIRVPVFQPAIWVDNTVLRAIEWITRRKVGGGGGFGREKEGKKKDGLGAGRTWNAEGVEAGNSRAPKLRQGRKKAD